MIYDRRCGGVADCPQIRQLLSATGIDKIFFFLPDLRTDGLTTYDSKHRAVKK